MSHGHRGRLRAELERSGWAAAWLAVVLVSACGGSTPPATTTTTATSPTTTATTVPPSPSTTSPTPTAAEEFVLYNGLIVTMDADHPEAQAVLIHHGTIAVVGSNEEVLAAAESTAVRIDLNGLVVFPGFIDGHGHRITQRYKWGFERIEEAAAEALAQGWTGLTELAVDQQQFEDLRLAASEGRLPIRVDAYLLANTFEGDPLGDWYNEFQPGQTFGPNLRIAGLKIFIDFDSGRTLLWTAEDLAAFIGGLQVVGGWPVSMKTISPQSHELALTALELLDRVRRVRFEHSLVATDAHITRMAQLGVVASIQPSIPAVVWDVPDIRALADDFGVDTMFRWPEYDAAGIVIAGSPYNPDGVNAELLEPSHISPMGLLYRGVTQAGVGDTPPEPWMLDHALTADQVLASITTGSAFATLSENWRGSIRRGMWADLVVLSADPRSTLGDNLLDIDTVATMVGGGVAFCGNAYEVVCTALAGAPTDLQPLVITGSAALESHPFDAFDGRSETAWISGLDPEQWIQAEFPEVRTISSIRLTVAQSPAGETRHQIWGGSTVDTLVLLHVFAESTAEGQVLVFEPASPIAEVGVIRIVTIQSPSWVAWREIEFG